MKDWRYIPSKLNVADEATKGNKIPIIKNKCRWFRGPDYLLKKENEWLKEEIFPESTEETVHKLFMGRRFETLFDLNRLN